LQVRMKQKALGAFGFVCLRARDMSRCPCCQ
jgi:hypothetical protein